MRHLTILVLGLATLSSVAGAQATTQTTQPPRQLPTTRVVGDTSHTLLVQNDRSTAVTVYTRSGAFDRRLGIIPAGKVASIALPAWATDGETQLKVFARADGEGADLVTQTLPLRGTSRLGLLVPPRGGLAQQDSVAVKLSGEEQATTTLTISNERNTPLTVYADRGSYSVRLGEVRAKEQATLRIPTSLLPREGSIKVFVRPAGGADLASQTMSVKVGDHLGMRIAM
jgi:hypothetical protein